jgi:DNA-binding NarL/FixJ family response regulator
VTRACVVVADRLRIIRSGVRSLLEREAGFDVVEAASLDELLAAVAASPPDIVLVDLDLPPTGGTEAVRELSRGCAAHIVVWGLDDSPAVVLGAMGAGADGYLHKRIPPEGLVRALRGALDGQAPLSRDLVPAVIGAWHGAAERAKALERTVTLSAREHDVLDLIAHGARNREIADSLAISEFTVKRHVQNILRKLELPSRSAAAGLYSTAFALREVPAGAG